MGNMLKDLIKYFRHTPKEIIEKDMKDLDKYNETGPDMLDILPDKEQISQLMPYFGGAITDEEWERSDVEKFSICRTLNRISLTCYWSGFYLLAFHTKEQRNNFIKYNNQLVNDYLMLD